MKRFKNLFKEMENPDIPSRAAMTYKEKPNKEPMKKLKEENDTTEKTEMVQSQLHFIKYACEEILEYIDDGGEIEEWYQVKVAKSFSEFESLHAYMEGESRRTGMKEETEQLDELSTEKMLGYRAKAVRELGKGTPEQDVKRKAGIGVSGMKIKQKFKQSMKKEEVEELDEVSSEMLDRYKEKAKKSADELSATGQHKKSTDRWGNIMKATGKQITKTAAGIGKALRGEEVEHLEEKNVPTSPEKWAQAKAQAKAKFDVYPSAYANGWAAKKYKEMGGGWKSVNEESELDEDLRKWFDPKDPEGGWKRINSKGEAIGPCAREEGEAKPKCMSNEKRASLTKKERASAVRAKRKHDSDPERKGEPINVSNYGKGKISEQNSDDIPFDGPYKKDIGTVTDKSGAKHTPQSRVRHLARQAMEKQKGKMSPMKKTVRESKKTEIVKDVVKNKKEQMKKAETFVPDPVLTSNITKT
jgi:hypothetical protein